MLFLTKLNSHRRHNFIMETTQEKTFDLLEATGLNWTVSKELLTSSDGKITESFGMFRSDNKEWLGTVGNRYKAMQNFELAETMIGATAGIGLKASRGGQLAGGAKVYLQASLPDEFVGKSGIKRMITALNSHDGSSSIGFGSTNTVVVCTNTFHTAYRGLDKFRHTENAKSRIENAIADLRKAMQLDQNLMDSFKKMADIELKDEMTVRIMRKLFDVDANAQQKDVSTRKVNQLTAFADSLATEVNLEGKTCWALFNAVTRYTNHVAAPKGIEEKNEYLMSGGGYKMSNIAYADLMQWVDERTAHPIFITR